MHIFFTPDITTPIYTLNEEESKHCIRVLRLKSGDRIQLVDGKGGWYEAEITGDHPKHCEVRVSARRSSYSGEAEEKKRDWTLHIAIAPTKNMDRLEWFIEKATETGIDEISLLDCHQSERGVVKTERLQRVAVSAMKQSQKAYLPQLNDMLRFEAFLKRTAEFNGQKLIAHCHSRLALPHLRKIYRPGSGALVLIGPEGDFSEEEVQLALKNGFQEISLGSSRLRTETAALYACTALNVLNE